MLGRGIWPNEYSFDPAQDGRIRADAEGEAKNGEGSKARIPKQHARTEAQILDKFVAPSPDTLLTCQFLDLLDSAKFAQRCMVGVVRRHTIGNVSLGQSVDVLPQLFRHFRFLAALTEETTASTQPGTESQHITK